MSKSQEELDRLVIEAADKQYEYDWGSLSVNLAAAVRARREAMRPHKAAVLAACMADGFAERREVIPASFYEEMPENIKRAVRKRLAELLAAPDEVVE